MRLTFVAARVKGDEFLGIYEVFLPNILLLLQAGLTPRQNLLYLPARLCAEFSFAVFSADIGEHRLIALVYLYLS